MPRAFPEGEETEQKTKTEKLGKGCRTGVKQRERKGCVLSLAAFAVRSGFATVRSVRPGSFGVVIHSVPAKIKNRE